MPNGSFGGFLHRSRQPREISTVNTLNPSKTWPRVPICGLNRTVNIPSENQKGESKKRHSFCKTSNLFSFCTTSEIQSHCLCSVGHWILLRHKFHLSQSLLRSMDENRGSSSSESIHSLLFSLYISARDAEGTSTLRLPPQEPEFGWVPFFTNLML